jgi:multidrug efflux pump subunit AcrA (membrane-fusion protein)
MRTPRWTVPGLVAALAIGGLLLVSGAGRAAAAELDCLMQPREVVSVSAPVEGVLERVAADRGDLVHAGSVLAVLESSLERSAVAIVARAPTRSTTSSRTRSVSTSVNAGSRARTRCSRSR